MRYDLKNVGKRIHCWKMLLDKLKELVAVAKWLM